MKQTKNPNRVFRLIKNIPPIGGIIHLVPFL